MIPLLTTYKEIISTTIDEILICLAVSELVTIFENSGVKYSVSNTSKLLKSILNNEDQNAHNEQIGTIDIIR